MSKKKTGEKIVKSIRKKLFPLEVKEGPGAKDRIKKLDKKSPYYNVDELGSPPLHRGSGASGVEKKKLKDAGKRISEEFKKQDKQKKIRDLRMGGSKYGFKGGGIARRGFGRALMKGGKVR